MSRPSSRLSAGSLHTRDRDEPARQYQQLHHARSASSLSVSNAMAPFTPGPAASKTVSGRNSRLGLSVKEVNRLSETIASVQRGARSSLDDANTISNGLTARQRPASTTGSSRSHATSATVVDRKGKARGENDWQGLANSANDHPVASVAPNASFLAEASFVDAPLNSRVKPVASASPSKQRPRTDGVALPKSLANERLTTTRLRQIISGGEDEHDNEQDLKQYTEYQEDESGSAVNAPLDDLTQADLSIQEALLVEDLLSVLTVSGRALPNTQCMLISYTVWTWSVHHPRSGVQRR